MQDKSSNGNISSPGTKLQVQRGTHAFRSPRCVFGRYTDASGTAVNGQEVLTQKRRARRPQSEVVHALMKLDLQREMHLHNLSEGDSASSGGHDRACEHEALCTRGEPLEVCRGGL
eukprot:4462135-Pleurochrysis_carterae.AAC.1